VVVTLLLLLPVAGLGAPVRAVDVTPAPTVVEPGDPRSEGEGAGLVGQPLLVAGGVIVLGILAAGATLVYARLTREA
jgi:hypothetical protein